MSVLSVDPPAPWAPGQIARLAVGSQSGSSQNPRKTPGSVEPAPITAIRCAMAVPPQLARKMSVLSVDPPAPWAPGQIAAGRAHRPGSRRLGGVEAPGASPATGASWPDRRKGWASPGRGPVVRISRMGCVDPNPGGPTWGVPQIAPWGRGLAPLRGASTASTTGFYRPGPYGVAKKKSFPGYLQPCPLACPGSIDSKSADRLRGAGARLGDGVPVVGGLRPPKAARS